MFDVPEDVVELKAIIGSQRAEIKEKDNQLDYANAAAVEAQKELEILQRQFAPLEKKMEEYSENIVKYRSSLAEKDATLKFKEDEITQQKARIAELEVIEKRFNEEYVEKVKQFKADASKEKVELETRIKELEAQLLDDKLASTESQSAKENVQKLYNDLTKKHNDLINKYEQTKKNFSDLTDEVKRLHSKVEEEQQFKKDNLDIITYFERMKPIFEEEAIFKSFLIVRSVGHISISDLKNAIGLPTVTIQKFVQKFVDNNVFEYTDTGEVTLKKDFLEDLQ